MEAWWEMHDALCKRDETILDCETSSVCVWPRTCTLIFALLRCDGAGQRTETQTSDRGLFFIAVVSEPDEVRRARHECSSIL